MRWILSLIVVVFFLYSAMPNISWPVTEETGTVLVFFCPETDCMALFSSVMRQAKQSIHCALYDLSEEMLPVFDQRSLDIALIYDARNKLPQRKYLHPKKGNALSHNKFCVIDNQFVWTGSFNPTARENHNDVLLISSKALAENYEAEFQELRTGKSAPTPHPIIKTPTFTLENAFCPDDSCEQKVIAALEQAKTSVYIMAFSFTHPALAQLLVKKKQEGVDVRVLLEARQVDEHSTYGFLKGKLPVKASNDAGLLHNKVFIIDNATIVTGSANPTKNGYFHNDENILILQSPVKAQQYAYHFFELWNHVPVLREKTNKQAQSTGD